MHLPHVYKRLSCKHGIRPHYLKLNSQTFCLTIESNPNNEIKCFRLIIRAFQRGCNSPPLLISTYSRALSFMPGCAAILPAQATPYFLGNAVSLRAMSILTSLSCAPKRYRAKPTIRHFWLSLKKNRTFNIFNRTKASSVIYFGNKLWG